MKAADELDRVRRACITLIPRYLNQMYKTLYITTLSNSVLEIADKVHMKSIATYLL